MVMDPVRVERLRTLFERAASLDSTERDAFILESTAGDESVRIELLAMLAGHADSQSVAPIEPTSIAPRPSSAPRRDPAPPAAGTQVDNYRLLREIGRGGMGIVYQAVRNDDVFHKVVALKIIGAGLDEAFVERFKQERQILAGLDHQNIARILDGGDTPDGRPYYVMEYIAGSPIHEHCAKLDADLEARLRLFVQVCTAVEYLHEQAIVHRDLKPSNVLVTSDGRVKLLDFGIAKVQTVSGLIGSRSGQETMLLTPNYASPEQLEGETVTKASDVYSLGVMLYELLTGDIPSANAEAGSSRQAALPTSDPVPPSKVVSAASRRKGHQTTGVHRRISADLDRVTLTALKHEKAQRYASVPLLREDLQRILDGRPIASRGDNWMYQFSRFVGRNKVAAALAVLAVLATGVAGAIEFRARLAAARIEAREAELDRIIAMLNARVEKWAELAGTVALREKLGDVQQANVVTSQAIPELLAQGGDPKRVVQMVGEVRRFLDRADELSKDEPPVRKTIALTYRKVGDLQATALAPSVPDKGRKNAIVSYQRAAAIAASVGPDEQAWAEAQIDDLSQVLNTLGSKTNLPVAVATAEVLPQAAPPPPPPPLVKRPPPSVSPPPAVPAPVRAANSGASSEELEELEGQLRTVTIKADEARKNIAALQQRLAAQGQQLRPEIAESMSRVDMFAQQARTDLDRGDTAGAAENLQKASYTLRRLVDAVGR
jgi:eukaryotic-like serine/threonine-protein kinase